MITWACFGTLKAWLKLGHQQHNDPKHRSKSTTKCLRKKIIRLLQWSKVQTST